MADSYKYFGDNISKTPNNGVPSSLSPDKIISDDFLASVGLYSKEEIANAKFNKFSRFGRVLNPYGKLNDCREYLFFTKPDLHIAVPYNEMGLITTLQRENEIMSRRHEEATKTSTYHDITDLNEKSIYAIGVKKGANLLLERNDTAVNGMILNPQLNNNSYFRRLLETHPDVVRELQYSASIKQSMEGYDDLRDPFCHLLSFMVTSYLDIPSSDASTLDTPATIFGTNYEYLKDAEENDENHSFSLEFADNRNLDTFNFFKAYKEYHIARKSGLVTPPTVDYYRYKRLHNTMGIYKFIVAEDMETIIYYAYLWGVFPTTYPRSVFSDPMFDEGLKFSIDFKSAFIEDMNPLILKQFNELMKRNILRYGIDTNKWLPVVRQDRKNNRITLNNTEYDDPSYDPSVGDFKKLQLKIGTEINAANTGDINYGNNTQEAFGINAKTGQRTDTFAYNKSSTSMINGTLPVAALVDGRIQSNMSGSNVVKDPPRFKLRWYGIPEGTTNG